MDAVTEMFDNAVTRAVEAMEGRLPTLDPAALARLEEHAADPPEFDLRQMMAEANAAGALTHDPAVTLYGIAEDWSQATLAQRIVWYWVAGELAQRTA